MTLPAVVPALRGGRLRASRRQVRTGAVIALIALLPMIFQSFAYIIDVGPLYNLSKALPFILLPLAAWAFVAAKLPDRGLFLALAFYAATVTTVMSMADFDQGFVQSLAGQTKLAPITFYFSFFAILAWLQPGYREMKVATLALGVTTLVLLPLLWVTVPVSWYLVPDNSKLFLIEEERGYRLTLPLFFGQIAIFFWARRFIATRRLLPLLCIVAGLAFILLYNKQRLVIGGMFAIVLINGFRGTSLARKVVFLGAAALSVLILTTAVDYFDTLFSSESGSVTVRQRDVEIIFEEFGKNPWTWITGLGAVSPLSDRTFRDIYNHFFYLADIGWLGIIYEYGLIGAGLIAAIYLRIVVFYRRRLAAAQDPLLGAFYDHILYQLLTSPVFYVIYAPAEWAATLAVLVYFERRLRRRPLLS